MKRMKKGSLQLSINAIVIIILAITLLGLGLGFVRTFMGKGTEQFTGIIEGVALENQATAAAPFTVDRTININSGERKELFVGFYCDDPGGCENAKFTLTKCMTPAGLIKNALGTTPNDAGFSLVAAAATVEAHKDIGFRVFITQVSATEGEHICTAIVDDLSGADPAGKDWAQQKQISIIAG